MEFMCWCPDIGKWIFNFNEIFSHYGEESYGVKVLSILSGLSVFGPPFHSLESCPPPI